MLRDNLFNPSSTDKMTHFQIFENLKLNRQDKEWHSILQKYAINFPDAYSAQSKGEIFLHGSLQYLTLLCCIKRSKIFRMVCNYPCRACIKGFERNAISSLTIS